MRLVHRGGDNRIMLTQDDRLHLIGLTALVIEERKKLDRTEAAICGFLKQHGVDEHEAHSWAGELVYNEGDDAEAAVERTLTVLDLEVESCSE